MKLVTGVITFDKSGEHFLDTFEGRFLIPGSTLSAAWCRIMAQKKKDDRTELESIIIAGRLARGRVNEIEMIEDLSYLIKGEEMPEYSQKEKSL